MEEPRCLITLWASAACCRDSFTFFFCIHLFKEAHHTRLCISYAIIFSIYSTFNYTSTCDSLVGIATGYGLDGLGSISGRVKFTPLHSVQADYGAHPASYGMCTGYLSPWVKRPGREADHTPPSSAEVKNGGAVPPLPHLSSWRGR
jgi:hypothetical protein